MRKNKALLAISTISLSALTLAACSNNKNTNNDNQSKSVSKFAHETPVKKTKQGGTLKVALETDTPILGIFADELATNDSDALAASLGDESLFDTDDNFKITDKGPATLKLDQKAKTITITVKKGVKWSDGVQVTAKDIEYSYEMLANKDTNSVRYSGQLEIINGLKEYHEGKAKTISGIEMPDGENGRTVVIHCKELKPGMSNSGNRFFSETAEPYHYLKNIPFKKLKSSDEIRKKPLFFGPFKVDKVVRGQSVTWSPNKYYWRGKPKLDKIHVQVISTNSSSQALKNHRFDVIDVINTQWPQVKKTDKVNFIAKVPLDYHYLGFKVGKFDNKLGKSVMNKDSKMNNKALRQAMGYAMNVDAVDKRYTYGLNFRIPTLIPAPFGDYYDKNAKGFPQNLKKANALLDKAGYKKKGKWRTQPNGKPLKINFAAMTGDQTQEPIIQNYIQQWHKIGLNVKLAGGRLMEFNSFYDKIESDDPSIDMFIGHFGMPSEPSPRTYYSEGAGFNLTRFVTKKNTKLINEIDSQKAFNRNYRVKKFHEWQEYMNEEAYVIPIDNAYKITAINDQVTGYSLKPSSSNNNHTLWYKVGYSK